MTDGKSLPPEHYKALSEFMRRHEEDTHRKIAAPLSGRQRVHSDRIRAVETAVAVSDRILMRMADDITGIAHQVEELEDRVEELRIARAWAMGAFAVVGAAASYLIQQLLGG